MSVPGKRTQHGYKPLKPLKGPPVPPKPAPELLASSSTPGAAGARQKLQKTLSAPFFCSDALIDIGSEISAVSGAGSGTTPEVRDQTVTSRSMSMSVGTQLAKTPPALPTISKSMSISVTSRKPLIPPGLNTLAEGSSERPVKLKSMKTDNSAARTTKPIPPPKNMRPLPLPPKRPSDYLTCSPAGGTKPSANTARSNGTSAVTDVAANATSSESSSSTPSSSPSSSPQKTVPLTTGSQDPIARQHPVTFARPPPKEMEYTEREHPRTAFEYLNQMRKRGDLCDVTLIVDTKEIRAHKVVLAACSQYFEQMFIGEFAEPDDQPIFIDEVEEDALTALVEFSYSSRIKLTDHNIYSLFEAADLLQFPGVKGACFKYFKQQINKSNCIRTWLFAEGHSCTELMEAALRYIQCNFLDIVRGREFLNLEQPDIIARLIELEDIAITSEEQVYEAVLGWLHHEPVKRKEHAVKVMQNVRFPSMSRDYLMHIVDHEPFIKVQCVSNLNSHCCIHVVEPLT